jgi:hypothetical protein
MIQLRNLGIVIAVGFALRLVIALGVEFQAQKQGTLCLFEDTRIYWQLGRQIAAGQPYLVLQYGIPHHAIRTPGYPAFLALMQKFGGDRTLPVRLVQVGLGTLGIPLIAALAATLLRQSSQAEQRHAAGLAAWLYALEPYTAASSAFLLSEALSLPLLMIVVLGLARLIAPVNPSGKPPGQPPEWFSLSIGTGIAAGASILVRPSVAPFLLLGWMIVALRGPGRWLARGARLAVLTGAMLILLLPWWIRNERILHAFVPTALWMGASLYDGWNPDATGASDMRFLDDPRIAVMGELEQDRYLAQAAWDFARQHPARVLSLALAKAARFWSPWPQAQALRSAMPVLAGCLVTLPVYGLILAGAWIRRRDPSAVLLLLGPVVTTALLHLIFVGSLRYRVAVIPPAFVLAAVALVALVGPARFQNRPSPPNS